MNRILTKIIAFGVSVPSLLFATACSGDPGKAATKATGGAPIYPDYKGVTVPVNIAPLNFRVRGVEKMKAEFNAEGGEALVVVSDGTLLSIPEKKWSALLDNAKGKKIDVTVSIWSTSHPEGIEFPTFPIYISADSIDPYISYRLIEPGYEGWKRMGIYQRNLSNFEEKAIADNYANNDGCINCHSYSNYSPETMMFHARGNGGGTVIYKDGELTKINLTEKGPKKQAVYPRWHPEGRYIAFSSNDTHQTFYGPNGNPLEVYDISSDLIIYDTEKDSVIADPRFLEGKRWETFPEWSPDGKWLYFSSADSCNMPADRDKLRYDILRVGFDAGKGAFTEHIDTVVHAAVKGGSASYARISPDGKYLLYTLAEHGTFPVWHESADLRIVSLEDGSELNTDILNSKQSESYHSWSSSGRWILFASRRLDNRFTRLFIAHIDADGKLGKPFLLPQEDPERNVLRMKSYNIPEFMKGEVNFPKEELKSLFQPKP